MLVSDPGMKYYDKSKGKNYAFSNMPNKTAKIEMMKSKKIHIQPAQLTGTRLIISIKKMALYAALKLIKAKTPIIAKILMIMEPFNILSNISERILSPFVIIKGKKIPKTAIPNRITATKGLSGKIRTLEYVILLTSPIVGVVELQAK